MQQHTRRGRNEAGYDFEHDLLEDTSGGRREGSRTKVTPPWSPTNSWQYKTHFGLRQCRYCYEDSPHVRTSMEIQQQFANRLVFLWWRNFGLASSGVSSVTGSNEQRAQKLS